MVPKFTQMVMKKRSTLCVHLPISANYLKTSLKRLTHSSSRFSTIKKITGNRSVWTMSSQASMHSKNLQRLPAPTIQPSKNPEQESLQLRRLCFFCSSDSLLRFASEPSNRTNSAGSEKHYQTKYNPSSPAFQIVSNTKIRSKIRRGELSESGSGCSIHSTASVFQ